MKEIEKFLKDILNQGNEVEKEINAIQLLVSTNNALASLLMLLENLPKFLIYEFKRLLKDNTLNDGQLDLEQIENELNKWLETYSAE